MEEGGKKEGGKNGGIRQGVDWVRLVKCFANFFPFLSGVGWLENYLATLFQRYISPMFREIRQNRDIYAK